MTEPQPSRLRLPPDALGVLGAFAAAPLGPLSVLSAGPATSDMSHALVAAGALTGDATPTTAFAPMLDVLAAPRALAQLHLTGGGSLVELQVHSSGDRSVSILSTPDGLEFEAPAATDRMVRMLSEHLGYSMMPSLTISIRLDPVDAVVFAATIDHHRRRALEALLAGRPYVDAPADDDEVRSLMTATDAQWFAPIVSALAGDVTAASATTHVGRLPPDVARAARDLALRFVVFDRVLTLTSVGISDGDQPLASQVACVQAGVHDLVVIEPGPDGVGFVTLPSALVLARVAALLADPGRELAAASPGEPAAAFCSQCGTAFGNDDRFCAGCGTPRP